MFDWWARRLTVVLVISLNITKAYAINPHPQQQPLQIHFGNECPRTATSASVHRVAVIGAGAAGSSTAYHLQRYAAHGSIPLNITIYESSSRIGGRTTTVNALGEPCYPTELGASIFARVNHILVNAAKDFGLSTVAPDSDRPKESKYELGVWDGREFVYRSANNDDWPSSWLDTAKLLWRYGLAPLKMQRLVKDTVAKFMSLYGEAEAGKASMFPWSSLTEVAMRAGLLDATASTGWQFLRDNGVGEKFSREVIQASTRVNYGQNLGLIHGLETTVCMATDGAMAVEGGNWRIFDGMVKRSGAQVRLNTSVEEIIRLEGGGYRLVLSGAESQFQDGTETVGLFDTVVIAAPFQYSGIRISPTLPHQPDEIPYVTLYVTLLTSPHRLSPKFFSENPNSTHPGQDPNSIPEMVITSLPADIDLGSSPQGVGPTKFWSISTLRALQVKTSTTTTTRQYLYKIFSPEPLTATFCSRLFDFPLNDEQADDGVQHVGKEHISWSYEKKWHSYPYGYPRLTFEDLDLDGQGLWYTSGMESFISTMETNALMGKNVAKLFVDGLVSKRGERTV